MDIKAFKMDGLGNDFVIIDQRSQDFNLNKDQIIKVCDRSFIGCDQLILIKKNKEIDADVEFYNSDGSVSGACGSLPLRGKSGLNFKSACKIRACRVESLAALNGAYPDNSSNTKTPNAKISALWS